MGKHKSKIIVLANGYAEGYGWRLRMSISAKQRKWNGSFTLAKRKGKNNGNKNIYLAAGSEEGWGWRLEFNASEKCQNWSSYFYLENETQKYRDGRRNSDNCWANRTFPRCWKRQFQIHHSWDCGETCYFLTAKEHHDLHQAQA